MAHDSVLASPHRRSQVTLGDTKSCFGLTGTDRELCRLKHAKHPLTVGKSKFI